MSRKLLILTIVFSLLLQPLLSSAVYAEEVKMKYTDPNHLHAPKEVNGITYQYDANGNLTDDGERIITWNQDNLPIKIVKNGKTVEFFYDASGRRIAKKSEEGETIYVNQYYQLFRPGDGRPPAETKYYFANGRLAQKTGDNLVFLHQDHLGSTVLATNSNSQPLSNYLSYFPYGSSINSPSPDGFGGAGNLSYLFTGQEKDPESNLYNYNARLYNPRTGVFISADSVQGYNRYAYAASNPMVFIDPSGHDVKNSGGGGPYLPMIMKKKFNPSPVTYFDETLSYNLFSFQKYWINPEKDPRLREFLTKASEEITKNYNSLPDEIRDQRAIHELVAKYIHENVKLNEEKTILKTIISPVLQDAMYQTVDYPRGYTPLGLFTEEAECAEYAALTYELLKVFNPNLEIYIAKTKVETELNFEDINKGHSILTKLRFLVHGGSQHAIVMALSQESAEPLIVDSYLGLVMPQTDYENIVSGMRIEEYYSRK